MTVFTEKPKQGTVQVKIGLAGSLHGNIYNTIMSPILGKHHGKKKLWCLSKKSCLQFKLRKRTI